MNYLNNKNCDHFWCFENECLLNIKAKKLTFNWDEWISKIITLEEKLVKNAFQKNIPLLSEGGEKVAHEDQRRAKDLLKNLRLVLGRKEKK